MYAIIENNAIIEYPITNLRARFPQTSFPKTITEASLPPGVVQVHPGAVPQFNAATHHAAGASPVHDGTKWVTCCTVYPLPAEEVEANQAAAAQAMQQSIVDATQQRLDAFARTRNYDGILSACTYATSTIPKFAAEGQVAVNLRDATWAALYQILEEVQAGQREAPTGFSDIEPLLPPLEWPV